MISFFFISSDFQRHIFFPSGINVLVEGITNGEFTFPGNCFLFENMKTDAESRLTKTMPIQDRKAEEGLPGEREGAHGKENE